MYKNAEGSVNEVVKDVHLKIKISLRFFLTLDPDLNPGTFRGVGPQIIIQFWWKVPI